MALSEKLTTEFGRGFSVRNLGNMRTFYISFKNETFYYLPEWFEKPQRAQRDTEKKSNAPVK